MVRKYHLTKAKKVILERSKGLQPRQPYICRNKLVSYSSRGLT